MGSVQARWATPAIDVDIEADPFAPMPSVGRPRRVEDVGIPIDLTDDQPKLRERLIELCSREGNLYNEGVTCSIKERDDTSCHACPLKPDDDTALLCAVGREQEAICTKLAVLRCSS